LSAISILGTPRNGQPSALYTQAVYTLVATGTGKPTGAHHHALYMCAAQAVL